MKEERVYQIALSKLRKRGVNLDEIADLVFYLQKDYHQGLTLAECQEHVEHVLRKREVQNAILTGIELDILAEKNILSEPLLEIIRKDESLYGIDEILATSILNVYGSIGLTNYGFIDRVKPGILKRLDNKDGDQIHTFLDDLVGALAASAAARLSHNRKKQQDAKQES
ncbi:phosphatidylglycerophosphatase A family protein [Melghirimyces algeriensis]|uniref:Phosphatidylglycerophosphatase A n=1 Tax=Melghirimyces algeriensis TaxID=910412 RepID=A0A521EH21_9BACL|nr:phosphatidylglycerophosphatase A [Melghirimyces algeriensis]SMO83214.1 Phosphatidylglycerophosphatase A [Melghirimyces algeriensis]